MAIYINEDQASRLIGMSDALPLIEDAFVQFSNGTAFNTPRTRARIHKGALHILPASMPAKNVMGYKAYTSFRDGLIFRFYLHSSLTGELLAIIDANEIGRLRTGAASGIATKYMAPKDASKLTVFGAGYQAEAQIAAICHTRKIAEIDIVNLTPDKGAAFAAEISSRYSVKAVRSDNPQLSAESADIITTVTWSATPVLDKTWRLKEGVHINACGSNALIRAEIPEPIVENSFVVVDDKEVSKLECGDILPSLEKGRLHFNQIAELGDVITGKRPIPPGTKITLFESQGMGLQDLVCADFVYRKALEAQLYTVLPF